MQHWHDEPDKNVSVLMGWDIPLQYFFCVVYPFAKDKHHLDEHLYSSLDEPDGDSVQSLHHYQKILADRFQRDLARSVGDHAAGRATEQHGPQAAALFACALKLGTQKVRLRTREDPASSTWLRMPYTKETLLALAGG
jgi:hypothetical protein